MGVSIFDANGDPQPALDASAFTSPVLFANPVVAGRLDGSFVVAYTDFEGDEDVLGIALTELDPEAGSAVPLGYANMTREFSQYDADILAVGQQLVVAWTDDRDAVDGPDLYYRVIGAPAAVEGDEAGGEPSEPPPGLTPGDEQPLATSPALEGNVALARLGDSWGAAWRASTLDGLETIEVRDFSTGTEWTVTEHLPGLWPRTIRGSWSSQKICASSFSRAGWTARGAARRAWMRTGSPRRRSSATRCSTPRRRARSAFGP